MPADGSAGALLASFAGLKIEANLDALAFVWPGVGRCAGASSAPRPPRPGTSVLRALSPQVLPSDSPLRPDFGPNDVGTDDVDAEVMAGGLAPRPVFSLSVPSC